MLAYWRHNSLSNRRVGKGYLLGHCPSCQSWPTKITPKSKEDLNKMGRKGRRESHMSTWKENIPGRWLTGLEFWPEPWIWFLNHSIGRYYVWAGEIAQISEARALPARGLGSILDAAWSFLSITREHSPKAWARWSLLHYWVWCPNNNKKKTNTKKCEFNIEE